MTNKQHEEITAVVTKGGTIPYGVGILPNPYWPQQNEVKRRHEHARVRQMLTDKIIALCEPRFCTAMETAECLEALITMTDSRRILETGTCTGVGTLHMLRAVYGKPGAFVCSIDARPAHDKEFWAKPEFKGVLQHIAGWTPEIFKSVPGPAYDFLFIDSDHSVEHTTRELAALWPLTHPGTVICFHDVPSWQTPENRIPPPVREWLLRHPDLEGLCLPSCEQMDCLTTYGPGYPKECNPGLGIFIRK